jgi:hypothetical protein
MLLRREYRSAVKQRPIGSIAHYIAKLSSSMAKMTADDRNKPRAKHRAKNATSDAND